MRWLAILALCAACKKQADAPPPPNPRMPASEVKRAQDACQAYLDKVCACAQTVPAMAQPCKLARAYPDAIQVGLEVGAGTDATRRDAVQTQDSVRKIAKECIEQLAKLPAAGCP
jgi:D-serine deaminase-like pyridoxal phosphate-dependent protein